METGSPPIRSGPWVKSAANLTGVDYRVGRAGKISSLVTSENVIVSSPPPKFVIYLFLPSSILLTREVDTGMLTSFSWTKKAALVTSYMVYSLDYRIHLMRMGAKHFLERFQVFHLCTWQRQPVKIGPCKLQIPLRTAGLTKQNHDHLNVGGNKWIDPIFCKLVYRCIKSSSCYQSALANWTAAWLRLFSAEIDWRFLRPFAIRFILGLIVEI